MSALWMPRVGYPRSPTPQEQPAAPGNQNGAADRTADACPRASVPVPGLRGRTVDLPTQTNPRTVYDQATSAPLQDIRKVRKAPVMTESDFRICDSLVRLRREWGLSQTQFARLCNVSLRTVKRWEARRGRPMARTRTLLGILMRCVEANGLAAFHEHYVREEPRYHKSGPAHRLAENAFDSRVGADTNSAVGLG